MKFLYNQKKISNYILISALMIITLFTGFSFGILYSGDTKKEEISLEKPPFETPLPLPRVDEKRSLGVPKKINKTNLKKLRPNSGINSPNFTHAVYHPYSLGYPENQTMNVTLYVIYTVNRTDPFKKNLVSENSGWNHCGSTILKNRHSRMGLFLTGEPLSDSASVLLVIKRVFSEYE